MSQPFAKVTAKLLKDIDGKVFDELKRRLAASGAAVRVGVPAGKTETDGTPLALIAAVHEYGSPERGIPERSFLHAGIQANRDQFVRLNRVNLVKVMNGKLTMDQALGQLGAMAAGGVQKYIREASFVPLKAETVKRKGSSKPLIDTAQLLQSITFEVGGKE